MLSVVALPLPSLSVTDLTALEGEPRRQTGWLNWLTCALGRIGTLELGIIPDVRQSVEHTYRPQDLDEMISKPRRQTETWAFFSHCFL